MQMVEQAGGQRGVQTPKQPTANIAEMLDASDLSALASECLERMADDEQTMAEWQEGADKGRELADLSIKQRSYPWDGAANIKWPLLVNATIQFNARAYPAIVPPDSPVKIKVYGEDPDGAKEARAKRVQEFMGFQLSEAVGWEDQMDAMLMQLPPAGALLRKVVYDPVKGLTTRTCTNFILDNGCGSFDRLARITERFYLGEHEIVQRVRSGRFIEWDYDPDSDGFDEFIEQHCRHDLDEDGYPEPLIVTIHAATQKVIRVEANFRDDDVELTQDGQQIVSITARMPYVLYSYMPDPRGGLLGIGLGHLIAGLSENINSAANQMLDAEHLAGLGGGFIGAGVSVRDGDDLSFRPNEYKTLPNSGSAIRDAIVQLQFPGSSPNMLNLLGILVDTGKDLAAVNETMSGEIATNMQPTTLLALIEQGEKVFTSSYKRIFRALRHEFRLMCEINAETLRPEVYVAFVDPAREMGEVHPARDFGLGDMDIGPVADPREVTNSQRLAKAQLLDQMAMQGRVDPQAATRRVLAAASVDNIDELLPKPDEAEVAQQQMMAQLVQSLQMEMAQADLLKKKAEVEKIQSETQENRAEAIKDVAKAMDDAQLSRIGLLLRTMETLSNVEGARDERRLRALASGQGNPSGAPARPGALGAGQELDLGGLLGGGPEGGTGAGMAPAGGPGAADPLGLA